jgi:hypothetical protein
MARKCKNWRKHLQQQQRIARCKASIEAQVIEVQPRSETINGAG